MSGSCGELGNWSDKNAVMMMRQGDFWLLELSPDVAHESIQYKYGICEKASGRLLFYEQGNMIDVKKHKSFGNFLFNEKHIQRFC